MFWKPFQFLRRLLGTAREQPLADTAVDQPRATSQLNSRGKKTTATEARQRPLRVKYLDPSLRNSHVKPRSSPRNSNTSNDGIQSDSPPDLTGQVTKSRSYPFASGGFGDVYKGILKKGDEFVDVAIKTTRVYSQHDHDLSKKKKQFRKEVTVWWKLDHPNVLPLFGTIWDETNPDIPAMVCPWAENGALTTYLEKNKHLSNAGKLVLVNDVAHGLQYLHSRNIVHGDLSGGNVLIDVDGRARLADFGLSVLLTQLSGTSYFTHGAKGTARWMAPELFSLCDSLTTPNKQSDVYSFGSIMLQILSGNIPYHDLHRNEQVIYAVGQGIRPRRPAEAAITDRRWRFIQWCWSPTKGRKKRRRPCSNEIVAFTSEEVAKQDLADGIGIVRSNSPRNLTGVASKSFGNVSQGCLKQSGKLIDVTIKAGTAGMVDWQSDTLTSGHDSGKNRDFQPNCLSCL